MRGNLIVAFEMAHDLWGRKRRVEVVQIMWHHDHDHDHDQWGRWKGNKEWRIEQWRWSSVNEWMCVCWSLSSFIINTGVCLLPSFVLSLSHVVTLSDPLACFTTSSSFLFLLYFSSQHQTQISRNTNQSEGYATTFLIILTLYQNDKIETNF